MTWLEVVYYSEDFPLLVLSIIFLFIFTVIAINIRKLTKYKKIELDFKKCEGKKVMSAFQKALDKSNQVNPSERSGNKDLLTAALSLVIDQSREQAAGIVDIIQIASVFEAKASQSLEIMEEVELAKAWLVSERDSMENVQFQQLEQLLNNNPKKFFQDLTLMNKNISTAGDQLSQADTDVNKKTDIPNEEELSKILSEAHEELDDFNKDAQGKQLDSCIQYQEEAFVRSTLVVFDRINVYFKQSEISITDNWDFIGDNQLDEPLFLHIFSVFDQKKHNGCANDETVTRIFNYLSDIKNQRKL